jgi:hypothetical protein
MGLRLPCKGFASKVSGPQALADTRKLDNVAASFLCDLADLADER